jgi:hypothetical protein
VNLSGKFTLFAQALAAVLAAASSLCAQTPPVAAAAVPASGPAIRFNTENYDFGKILKGDPVEYAFLATNVGDETLVISDAKGTCSCTVVGEGSNQNAWTPQQVAPGQTCRIPVQIATGSFWFQTISKIVEVTSNDKSRPVATLEIHGQVWLPIEVEPPISSFIITPGAANQSNDVLKIFNRTETPLTLSDPQCDTNAFSAVLKTNLPGREFELTVTAAPASVPPSTFGMTTIQGSISLKSSAAAMNPLKIGVSETIYPEVTIYPTNIEMPAGPLSQGITNHITIRGNRADLTLSNPAANVPGIEMAVKVIQTNRQYYLLAVFPKGFVIQPGRDILLSVQTDDPRFPVLTVPVTSKPGVINAPRFVAAPRRTSVLPPSILAVPAGASNPPAPSPPAPGAASRP